MTDRRRRRRLVDLSVVAISALTLGGGVLVAADVDRERAAEPRYEAPATTVSAASVTTAGAPLPGLVPAPRRPRRVVVVRRSRAS